MGRGSEIAALISLLDDEDPEIYENVSQKLISFGPSIIPELENAGIDAFNPKLHQLLEELIHTINFNQVYQELEDWSQDDLATLLDGALIVARYQYPEIDVDEVLLQLDKVKQKIWLELNNSFTPLENINIFNQVFYSILGFNGSNTDKTNITDFFFNSVLENKRGNSISLGILYVVLAQQLELPVYGVNLYRHFILAYQKNYVFDYTINNAIDTIFYMNPINHGINFPRRQIQDYLKSMKVAEKESFFKPASPKEIIQELLFYIQYYFVAKNEGQKAEEIGKLKDLLKKIS